MNKQVQAGTALDGQNILPVYCWRCGFKLEQVDHDTFNTYTGERNKKWVCQNVKCENQCNHYGHDYRTVGLWWNRNDECVKCGHTPRND